MSELAIESNAPSHVSKNLIWDHSLNDFCCQLDDPFIAASRLHSGPDIIWSPDISHGRPGWILTRQAHVREALGDYEHFSSADGSGVGQMLGNDLRPIPLDFDPPQHTAYRELLNPFFTPRAVQKMEEPVQEVCDTLISAFEDRGGCEFINEFAIPFPSYIFLSLVGLPVEEAPQFLAWEHGMLRGKDLEERRQAAVAVYEYLVNFAREQRKNPKTELLAAMNSAEIDGRPLTEMEIVGTLYTFYLGGLDTVYSTLGWIMRHLAMDQSLQQQLRENPDLLTKAVGEFARLYSVVSTMRRVAKDFTFHGVTMKAGDFAVMPLFLAARDPEAHENPHEIDLNRQSARMTFASGPHTCLGMHLARREIRIALESFLSRFDNIRIPEGESYQYHAGVVFGVDRLPLVWDKI